MLSNFILKKYCKNGENVTPETRAKVGKFSGIFCIVCNLLLFAAKLTGGIISGAVSVIADAINNLSDSASNVVSYFGFKMASRPADEEHPYGHGRYEYLSALTVSLLIMVIGVELLKSGIEKIITPTKVDFSWITLSVLTVAILVKLFLFIFNKRLGKSINSNALIATSADSRNDVIATSAVLIAAIISRFAGVNLDGYMTIAVALFILYSGFTLIKETLNPLLGKAPDKELVESIKRKILANECVLGAHDLMVHDYGAGRLFASVHIEMSAENDIIKCHEIIDNIERDFLKNDKIHMVIHLDPIESDCGVRSVLQSAVKQIDELLSVHDVKVLKGEGFTKIVFDCVAPKDFDISDEKLICLVSDSVKKYNAEYQCEITVDRNFAPVNK